MSKTQKLPRI